MRRASVALMCTLLLAATAAASLPLSKMSRVDAVEIERIRTEFIIKVSIRPNRGISGCRAYSVNDGTIVLVTIPRSYVNPPIKDFHISNDWIESISAHQVDRQTVNVRIALKNGYSVPTDRLRLDVAEHELKLHLPLPYQAADAPAATKTADESTADDEAQKESAETNEPADAAAAAANADDSVDQQDVDIAQPAEAGGIGRPESEPFKPFDISEAFGRPAAVQQTDEAADITPPSVGVAKFFAVSLGLCGLLLIGFGMLKRLKRTSFGAEQPRIVARCPLGFKKYLAIVEFEDSRFLIAVGPHDTALLARLDSGERANKNFEVMVSSEIRKQQGLSVLDQIKSKVAMLNPLDKR